MLGKNYIDLDIAAPLLEDLITELDSAQKISAAIS
jgi:hypothetical protein